MRSTTTAQLNPNLDSERDTRKLTGILAALYRDSSWLTVTSVLMLFTIVLSVVGLAIDPTRITGAPTWMKPLKFGISTFLFSITLAFMIGRLRRNARLASIAGRLLALALTLEITLIDMQAARHTTSHFNFTTPFDAYVFMAMGIGIAVVLLSTLLLFVLACRERMEDRSLAWTIRLGLLLAILGMGVGNLMTLPTPEQLAASHGHRMPHIGAHTVGAPDGGPGMPVTGWSADHGDLRIAHFVGLHAMQLLLAGWFVTRRRWPQSRQVRLIFGLTALFTLSFAALLVQALRGLPLLRPDTITRESWAVCLAAAVVTWLLTRSAPRSFTPASENSK